MAGSGRGNGAGVKVRQPAPPAPPPSQAGQRARRSLARETVFVELAFLLPAVVVAVDQLAAHLGGVATISQIPVIVRSHPLENLILGVASYLSVGAVVPLALLLLARTGQNPAVLGLTTPRRSDLLPGAGIAAAAYLAMLVISVPLSVVLAGHRQLLTQPSTGHLPAYYVVYGLVVAAVTAITEETIVNGYLLTRLEQLGWAPGRALLLSMILRTSYHVYYGLGFVFVIPFGYFTARSFQKHHRLTRPVLAHFLYDAAALTIAILAARHG